MRRAGFTLVELTVVVVILAIVAGSLLVTHTETNHERVLDAAAADVAAAIRFARSEAIRSGEPHGVDANSFTQLVRVYRLDTSVSPAVTDYSVRHPVDKKLYQLDFANDSMLGPVSMTSAVFWYSGLIFPVGFLGFNPDGTPKYTGMSTYMLASGTIRLSAAGQTRDVSVAPMTGRATIQ